MSRIKSNKLWINFAYASHKCHSVVIHKKLITVMSKIINKRHSSIVKCQGLSEMSKSAAQCPNCSVYMYTNVQKFGSSFIFE